MSVKMNVFGLGVLNGASLGYIRACISTQEIVKKSGFLIPNTHCKFGRSGLKKGSYFS